MIQGTLYFFEADFFKRRSAVQPFIDNSYKKFNLAKQAEKAMIAMSQSGIMESLLADVLDTNSKVRLRIAQSNLLYYAAMLLDKKELFLAAYNSINKIDESTISEWDNGLDHGYYYVCGNANLSYYEQIVSRETVGNYSISKSESILRAKYCYSVLLSQYLEGNISIDQMNTQSAINRYCHVLGVLSRYVEPMYLLEKLKKGSVESRLDSRQSQYYLLEAIKTNTCADISPIMLIRMERHLNAIKNTKKYKNYKADVFNEQNRALKNEIVGYCELNNIQRNVIAKQVDAHDRNLKNLPEYLQFVSKNNIGLNEHGLYCKCKDGLVDNLSILSGCEHNKITWSNNIQLLVEQVKLYFNSARKLYFKATTKNEPDDHDITIIDDQIQIDGIDVSQQSIDLCQAFKNCLSILDKIAHIVNAVHSIIPEQDRHKIDFVRFFENKKVKIAINSTANNLFLFALYSMAIELNNSSDFVVFPEFKKWRNAAEHDSLYLTIGDKNIDEFKNNNPIIRQFVNKNEFEMKTMFLLQFCRSAIFSVVWHARTVSRKIHKETSINNPSLPTHH